MNPDCRRLPVAALVGPATPIGPAICGRQAEATFAPAEADAATTYDLGGMLVADYPGSRAQLYYQGNATPHWCCDTVKMSNTLPKPEQARKIRAAFVQDMGQADWGHPRGHWFDARTGCHVLGSRCRGLMGPMVASPRLEADARTFIVYDSGKLLHYAEVTPDMADLSGGALHDGRMQPCGRVDRAG